MWLQRINGNQWDPFADVRSFLHEAFVTEPAATCTWAPAVDIVETADGIELHADLPGLARESIDIGVQDGVLTLRAERKAAPLADGMKVRTTERPYGTFERTFRLGDQLDPGAIEASYEAGVLRVKVLKRPEAKPRKVEVKVQ